jgi:hypothetical protein
MKKEFPLIKWNYKRFPIGILVFVSILFISLSNLTGQTTVFYDDFNRTAVTPGGYVLGISKSHNFICICKWI